MFPKYLLLIISLLATSVNKNNSRLPQEIVEQIKSEIRNEFLKFSMRLISGVIIACVLVFSLYQVSKVVSVYIMQFENATTVQFILFSFLSLASGAAIYFIFRAPKPKVVIPAFDIQSLILQFAEGAMLGFEQSQAESKNKNLEPILAEESKCK